LAQGAQRLHCHSRRRSRLQTTTGRWVEHPRWYFDIYLYILDAADEHGRAPAIPFALDIDLTPIKRMPSIKNSTTIGFMGV
jgi:hypothetical protein